MKKPQKRFIKQIIILKEHLMRRERVEELAKEFFNESEEWKESLIEREEILEEAQRIWSSIANKLDKTHLPNRIKLLLFPFLLLFLFFPLYFNIILKIISRFIYVIHLILFF